jgi:hypothetical protein
MYYTVYKITNLVNDKIYIGVHKTSDLEDDYMGSGKLIKLSIKKYGVENFKKEYIEVFDNAEDMFNMESTLVNEEFVKDRETYNINIGGYGGFESSSSQKGRDAMEWLYENDAEWLNNKTKKFTESMIEYYENGGKNGFHGKTHTEETKAKLKGHKRQSGSKNSQYGSMWIHNLTEKVSKKIKQDEFTTYENLGWIKGRKMKF